MMATFKDLEQRGWTERAGSYDPFAAITAPAIPTFLDRLGDIAGRDVLDICCGPGQLTGAAAGRAARATGVDFAPTMVARAAAAHPGATFRAGDAEALDFPGGSFDAAVCSFGINHFAEPERAMAEACRVLRPGGRYAASVWCGPEHGTFFRLVLGAIAAHGTLDVDLPPAPSIFRFAEEAEFRRCLSEAGFAEVAFEIVDLTWEIEQPQQVIDLIFDSIVRLPMILEAQDPAARDAILEAIATGAEAMRDGATIRFAFPAALAVATKA